MIKYGVIESFRRIVQMLFGNELFELPVLNSIKILAFRLVFDIKDNPIIGAHMRMFRAHKKKEGTIFVGKNVLLAKEAFIDYSGKVIIEDNVWISERVQIYTHTHQLTDNRVYGKDIECSELTLKEKCWVGAGAIILPSVHYIGYNSVIGAGAVVTKDVPDNVVVAGNPAVIVRRLGHE